MSIGDGDTEIGEAAFSECTSLISLDLGEGLTEIGASAFADCSSLGTLTLPSTVTDIDNFAFYGCTSLADVYSLNGTPPTCGSSYVFSTSTYSDATLHVPSEAVDVYKETSPWSSFYSIEATTGIATVTKDDGASVEAGDGVITVTGAEGTVSVYGIGGAKVGEASVSGGTVEISVPHGGVYVVRVASGGESVTTTVMVK